MIIDKNGAEFLYDGVVYRIGEEIIVTDTSSEYEGLLGSIYEICTDEDKDTDNDEPEFYCTLNPPVLSADIQRVEERFSKLYGQRMTLDDIAFDLVIFAPSMVRPFDSSGHKFTVFALEEDWAVDDECEHNLYLYSSETSARAYLNKLLSEERCTGCVSAWEDNEDFKEETCNNAYEGWLDGYYSSAHYSLIINQYEISLDSTAFGNIGRAYLDQSRREDLISQIEEWEEVAELIPDQYEKLKADPAIPDRIHSTLGKNDSFWESYWESVSEVGHSLVREHLEKQAEEGQP